jgi:DNA replication protein DnaC
VSQMPSQVRDAIDFCYRESRWPLYLWGPTGRGKTCAAAIAYSLWQPSATWMSLAELCDTLKTFNASHIQVIQSGGRPVEVTLNGFWERLRKMGLVVIDEIGTREVSAHRYDALLRLLETRQRSPLILTGNLDPIKKLGEVYDERVQSRISNGVMLHVNGVDRRLEGVADRIKF